MNDPHTTPQPDRTMDQFLFGILRYVAYASVLCVFLAYILPRALSAPEEGWQEWALDVVQTFPIAAPFVTTPISVYAFLLFLGYYDAESDTQKKAAMRRDTLWPVLLYYLLSIAGMLSNYALWP